MSVKWFLVLITVAGFLLNVLTEAFSPEWWIGSLVMCVIVAIIPVRHGK